MERCPDSDWSIKEVLDAKQSQIDWPSVQKNLICTSPDLNKKVNSVEDLKYFTSTNQCTKYYIKSESSKYTHLFILYYNNNNNNIIFKYKIHTIQQLLVSLLIVRIFFI